MLAPTHPTLLDAPTDLAAWYLAQDRSAEAVAYYERACLLADAAPLGAHPRLGEVLLGLGNAYRRTGDLDAAEAVLQRARGREAPGNWNASVAAGVMHQLGLCRVDAGRYAEAEVFLRRALDVATGLCGEKGDFGARQTPWCNGRGRCARATHARDLDLGR